MEHICTVILNPSHKGTRILKRKNQFTRDTYRVSKTINAPLRFVYDWCTDYREDDTKIIGSKSKRTILEKTKQRVIYTVRGGGGTQVWNAANIVTLHPPKSWHLDSIGDEDDEVGDYKLTSLGSKKTRLDMVFKEIWKTSNVPNHAAYVKHINEIWDKYKAALEKDYRKRKLWSPAVLP